MRRNTVEDSVETDRRQELEQSRERTHSGLRTRSIAPGERAIQQIGWIAQRTIAGSTLATTIRVLQPHPDWLLTGVLAATLLISASHVKAYKTEKLWSILSLLLIALSATGIYYTLHDRLSLSRVQPSATAGSAARQ